jgi:sRNA-binding regulator protein Hfq
MRFRNIIIILTLITLCFFGLQAKDGRKVTVYLDNGTLRSGELLSVRDSFVVITNFTVQHDSELISNPQIIHVFPNKDILQIKLEKIESDAVFTGALIGGLIGLAADVVILATRKSDTQASYPGISLYGLIAGLLGGYFVSSNTSKPEEFALPSIKYGFSYLKQYSRYSFGEPTKFYDIVNTKIKAMKK